MGSGMKGNQKVLRCCCGVAVDFVEGQSCSVGCCSPFCLCLAYWAGPVPCLVLTLAVAA
jgi:hypothetical protein